jgi:ADP-heptose:LPS heptosyltransferase
MAARSDTPVASFVGREPDLGPVRKVLLVRLRSIGDTVLMTPCITALKRWRPELEIDVLLEPFCAPLLAAHPGVARVVEVERSAGSRLRVAAAIRRRGYDAVFNLFGGSTGALLALATGAPVRAGYVGHRPEWLATTRVTSSHHVWGRTDVHTVEHQLALVAGIGVPVDEAPPTSLGVAPAAAERLAARLSAHGLEPGAYAVFHPEASLAEKRWPADRFARLASELEARYGLRAVVTGREAETVAAAAGERGVAMADLPLDETMALIAASALFVGNDSGPAHIAAAFARPAVVVFGPSNEQLWRPWSEGPWRALKSERADGVTYDSVTTAIEEVYSQGSTG